MSQLVNRESGFGIRIRDSEARGLRFRTQLNPRKRVD